MKLSYLTKAEAQAKADSIHAQMIASDPLYAESVASGQCKRWAIPYQDMDESGKPIDTKWHITVKELARKTLTALEISKVSEWLSQKEQQI